MEVNTIEKISMKNRKRSKPIFANINFLGKCNLDCFFCLGKDIEEEFNKYNYNSVHFSNFPRLKDFLNICKKDGIKQLYLTGQNTDPLLYKYLSEFIDFLKEEGFYVGIRTNGLLALRYMDIINKCTTCQMDAVAYTVLTLDKKDMKLMTGVDTIPDWGKIFKLTQVPFRVSIVITKTNVRYIKNLIDYLLQYRTNKYFKYIQLRRISTDTRFEKLKEHIYCFEEMATYFLEEASYRNWKVDSFEKAEIIYYKGFPVVLWRTVSTSVNSYNYFVNGVISKEYFIIEGYLKAKSMLEKW